MGSRGRLGCTPGMATPSAQGPARPAGAFARLSPNLNLPALETGVLALWQRLDAFQESIRRRADAPPFQFYDGPPFATGTPHYGHLLQSTVKDIVPRYWTMRGSHVERRFGWDCHGLPIEMLAQNALKLEGPADIRAYGVDRFNEQCRSMVQTYVGEWRRTITRLGRWVDFDNDYKTMDKPFMESVWWVFRQLWDQGRIYRSHRIMAYDPVLATPLSNFEAGNNYKDVQDPAITVRFPVAGPSAFPAGTAFPRLDDHALDASGESRAVRESRALLLPGARTRQRSPSGAGRVPPGGLLERASRL